MAAVLERGEGPRRGRGRSDHHRRGSGFPCGWLVCFRVVEQSLVPPLPGLWVNASRVFPLLLPSGFPIEHCRLSRQGDFPVPRLPPPEVSSLRIPALVRCFFPVFSHFENLLQIFVHNFFTFVKCLTHVDDLSNCCGKVWYRMDRISFRSSFHFQRASFFPVCF